MGRRGAAVAVVGAWMSPARHSHFRGRPIAIVEAVDLNGTFLDW
jgi:hypothetical protein